jgi:hypothetical protein
MVDTEFTGSNSTGVIQVWLYLFAQIKWGKREVRYGKCSDTMYYIIQTSCN